MSSIAFARFCSRRGSEGIHPRSRRDLDVLLRESSQRREREIEQMQQKNSEEIMKLNDGLRKAEQSRREAEIKLHPLQQRENDLAEELSRQKEKESILALTAVQDEKNRLEQLYLKEQVGCDDSHWELTTLQAGRRDDQVARLSAEGMLSKVQAELVRLRDFEQLTTRADEERAGGAVPTEVGVHSLSRFSVFLLPSLPHIPSYLLQPGRQPDLLAQVRAGAGAYERGSQGRGELEEHAQGCGPAHEPVCGPVPISSDLTA
eukprot:333778-Hanusia_phi.AAC.2